MVAQVNWKEKPTSGVDPIGPQDTKKSTSGISIWVSAHKMQDKISKIIVWAYAYVKKEKKAQRCHLHRTSKCSQGASGLWVLKKLVAWKTRTRKSVKKFFEKKKKVYLDKESVKSAGLKKGKRKSEEKWQISVLEGRVKRWQKK